MDGSSNVLTAVILILFYTGLLAEPYPKIENNLSLSTFAAFLRVMIKY